MSRFRIPLISIIIFSRLARADSSLSINDQPDPYDANGYFVGYQTSLSTKISSAPNPLITCKPTSSQDFEPATWCTACNQGPTTNAYATINGKTGDKACAFQTLGSIIKPTVTLFPPPTTPLPNSCVASPTSDVRDSHENAVVDSAQKFCSDNIQGRTQKFKEWTDIQQTLQADLTFWNSEDDDVYDIYVRSVPNCQPPKGIYTMDDPIPGYTWHDDYGDFYDYSGFGKLKARDQSSHTNNNVEGREVRDINDEGKDTPKLRRLKKRVPGPYACFDLIHNSWLNCNNAGRGGEIQAGCMVYGIRTRY